MIAIAGRIGASSSEQLSDDNVPLTSGGTTGEAIQPSGKYWFDDDQVSGF